MPTPSSPSEGLGMLVRSPRESAVSELPARRPGRRATKASLLCGGGREIGRIIADGKPPDGTTMFTPRVLVRALRRTAVGPPVSVVDLHEPTVGCERAGVGVGTRAALGVGRRRHPALRP